MLKLTFLLPKSVVQRQNCLIKALASGGCAPRPLHRYKGPYSGTLIVENYEILVPKSLFPSLNCLLTALASGGCAPRPLNRCSRHKLTCHVSRDLEKIYPKIAYPHFWISKSMILHKRQNYSAKLHGFTPIRRRRYFLSRRRRFEK